MKIVGLDTETDCFDVRYKVPDLCCLTWATGGESGLYDSTPSGLRAMEARLQEWAADPDVVFVGHNIAYDVFVLARQFNNLPFWIDLYRKQRVVDTGFMQRLLEIAGLMPFTGECTISLVATAGMYGLVPKGTNKDDEETRAIRTGFGQYIGKPIPPKYRQYAVADAEWPVRIFRKQLAIAGDIVQWHTLAELCYSFLSFSSMGNWGLASLPGAVDLLKEEAEEVINKLRKQAWTNGILRVDVPVAVKRGAGWPAKCGNKVFYSDLVARPNALALKALVEAELGDPSSKMVKADQSALAQLVVEAYAPDKPPMTEPSPDRLKKARKRQEEGNPMPDFVPSVSTSSKTLDESGCPILTAFSDYAKWKRILTTEVPLLDRGVIHARFDVCTSGRTRTSPNIQNAKQKGMRREDGTYGPCFRECLVPRPGNVLLVGDYPSLEVHTLAENMAAEGLTELSDRILKCFDEGSPYDPHAFLASYKMGIPYEEGMRRKEAKDPVFNTERRHVKPATFGFPVDMSPATYVKYCANMGQKITLREAEQLKKTWQQANPQNVLFLKRLSRTKKSNGKLDHRLFGHGIYQGDAYYTAVANARFQGPGAYVAWKTAQLLLERCYASPLHTLWGCRPVIFTHDEFGIEAPLDRYQECAEALGDAMLDGAKLALPLVGRVLRPEIDAMRFYSKRAEHLEDDKGNLLIWPENYQPSSELTLAA